MSKSENTSPPILQMRGMSRRFPGVLALDHVDFDVRPGEVHALVGENGAGKSTLINILAGVHQPSGGVLEIEGRPKVLPDPLSAQQAGISVIFQEFNLLPHLSVAENIFLNREPVKGLRIDWPELYRRATEVIKLLEIDLDPRVAVQDLPVAQQQLVEIARSLSKDKYGKNIVFWGGGIDSQHVLPFASPESVREEVKKNVEILKAGGGYVFNNVHNIQAGVPPENIVAMYEAAYEFGFYD